VALTKRQQEVLEVVEQYMEQHGYPPTVREIGEAIGLTSPSTVHAHLKALEQSGALRRDATKPRAIDLGERRREREARRPEPIELPGVRMLPMVGAIAAGSPILAEAHVQGRYQIDANLFRPRADYLLKVRGMSMRDAGILDGDLLAVHRAAEARSGQIVVARLGDEVTVKRLRRRGNLVDLEAANPDFATIEVDPRTDRFAIEGLAVGLVRNGKPL